MRIIIKSICLPIIAAICVVAAAKGEVNFFYAKLDKAGSLSEILGAKANEIDSLIVEGEMNETDFNTLWSMGFNGRLAILDLSKACPEGDKIPDNAFFHKEQQTSTNYYFKNRVLPLPYLNTVILPEKLKRIGNYAFAYTRIKTIEFPEGIEAIGAWSFYRCPALEGKVIVPNGIPALETHTFAECPGITEVEIPSSVEYISGYCFDKCHNLRKANFAEGLKCIDFYAFRESRLETLLLPKSISGITDGAFCDVTSLKSIYSLNPVAPFAVTILVNSVSEMTHESRSKYSTGSLPDSYYAFTGTPTDIPVYVPTGSREKYLYGAGWDRFTNIIECSDMPELPGGSAVETAEQDRMEIKFSVIGNSLMVKSDTDGASLTIHTIDGKTVTTRIINAGETRVALPSGIYLVRAEGESAKVII